MVNIKSNNASTVARKFYQSADNIRITRPMLADMGDTFRAKALMVWSVGGAGAWKSPGKAALNIRAIKGENISAPSMNVSGKLLSSWTQKRSRNHVQRITDNQMEIGTRLRYASYMERGVNSTGGWIVGKFIKARPVLANPAFKKTPPGSRSYAAIARDRMLEPWKQRTIIKGRVE